MQFAVISDLHIDVHPLDIASLGIDVPVDLCIVAGDLHPDNFARHNFLSNLEQRIQSEVLFIPGNHDYWGSTPALRNSQRIKVKDVAIAGATLWTELSPTEWVLYMLNLADYRYIRNWEEDVYRLAHSNQKAYLMTSEADIIVSHHGPSWQSISPQFKGNELNCAFVNDMDYEIAALKKPPKFWIHGHVHSSFDYYIDQTRVICNPRGYPHESNFQNYKARIFDV